MPGYTFDGFSGDCDENGKTTVALGETKTCTLTNSSQQAYIIVEKVVDNTNGGNAQPDDFNLTLNGNATTSGTQIAVDPGTYTAGETQLPGYTFDGFSGDCDENGKTTVALGETKTCTLTNSSQQAYIIVEKVVDNTNGGNAQPDDFNLTLNGNATTSGTQIAVDPGTYTAGETQLPGYTFDGFSGDCDENGKTTVALGETKTCTLTNSSQQAYIIVEKVVDNTNGGNAQPDDFNLTLNGNATTSGTQIAVDPGTYTAGETQLPGYTFDGFSGDCDENGKTTVALGETKTCTLTNSDQQAYIIVEKVVDNTNGGNAQPDDFNLTLNGNATTSGTQIAVDPGTYTAGETQLPGYTFDGFSGDCDENGKTTVALGETKTCTLTNSSQQAYIIVEKVVDNTNGGNAQPDDFNLTLNGNATTSGTQIAVDPGTYTAGETQLPGYTFDGFSGDCDENGKTTVALGETKTCTLTNSSQQAYIIVEKVVDNTNGGNAQPDDFNLTLNGNATTSGTQIAVDPGTYTAGETQLPGYTFDGFSGDCDENGKTTVALGETKTCTLTNSSQQAYIIVEKVVDNTNGGNAQPDDFNLTLNGNATTSGTQIAVDPGTYTAGETQLPGYTFDGFSGDCDENGKTTVALGETKTCTLTNSDIAPTLKLVKIVDNGANPGGTAVADDWTLSATAAAPDDGRNFSNAGGSGVFETVFANAGYNLEESIVAGYQVKADWSCDGGTQVGSTITLGLDEDVTCTIENEALGMVELLKLTNGVESQMTWNFTLTGPGIDTSASSPPTTIDFGGAKLIPGEEYTLCEVGIPAGWTLDWQAGGVIIPMVAGVNNDPVDPITGYSRVYDPNYVAPPGTYTNDTRCVNFIVGVGETLHFQINNQFPGGDPRTIGFWKNWNTCTGGNQPQTAAENGGPSEGWFILDDLLNNPGYTIGILQLDGSDCEDAVNILDKRDILSGKKKANDAAYNLAAQLLAAEVNLSAGAETCQEVVDAVNAAQTLLASIGFDGTGNYLRPKDGQQYQDANNLAATLDQYNNGDLCN